MRLSGHLVLVTGGASGIGFALARRFVEAGSRVIVVGRSEAKLAAAQRALPGIVTRMADVAAVDAGQRYCASKAALHSFSKTLRWQLEGTSVKVFEVLPPVVQTQMTAGRGRAKITPERVADEFCRGFAHDRFEMRIGLNKVFAFAHRWLPSFVEARVRTGQ